ncbi:MAG: sugar phosphate nucleotidyltransferase, partial [Coriobacteriia bacterium]|nr:sugar phosphate nucleotidyltransferase [Coriobacteriia bacterium]
LGLVKHHGISEAVATLAFMPQVIEDYFGEGDEWDMSMAYALEEVPLGTAGSVKNAEPLLGDDALLVISGDALTDIDLTAVIDFHKRRGAAVTIALKSVPDPLEFGVVITDEDGKIERFLEKPTWGQVFSDTINTGIYVIERAVLEHIPEKQPYDFSSQLFPKLMEMGYPLYGCVVDGYWCDVGSFESYVQVHRDVLDGKARIYIPGVQARDGLWVGEGTKVHPDAVLGDKVVIGKNVTVRAGANVGDYCVFGDNCVIGADARVSHSVLWNDTFVGKNASVRGAVLCRKVDVRSRASVDVGAVIGDETMIGHDAQVRADVQVYPYKRVEPAAVVTDSLIWESTGSRSIFGEDGISGLIGVDITPELALKAAQAFGSLLPKGTHVVVSRDSSRAARMVKRAMVAGLNSAGCTVRDLRVASSAINRFTTRDTRCVGGVHVCQSTRDAQTLEIHFYEKSGLDIAPWEEKKIERLYFRGEFRRAFLDEVGDIIYPPRAMDYYAAGLTYALERRRVPEGRWLKVVADLNHGVGSIVLPQVSSSWQLDLVSLNPFLDA